MKIVALNALKDNYIWIIHNESNAIVIDPTTSEEVLFYIETHKLNLHCILITHHHRDHIGGVADIKALTNCKVFAPLKNKSHIPFATSYLEGGEHLHELGLDIHIDAIPGHTLGHLGYYIPQLQAYFCGDTLFSLGCGKIFEGTTEMMLESFKKITQKPLSTQLFCAHEYTLFLADFALKLHSTPELQAFKKHCFQLRKQNLPTLPTALEFEIKNNPFLKSHDQNFKEILGQSHLNDVDFFNYLQNRLSKAP